MKRFRVKYRDTTEDSGRVYSWPCVAVDKEDALRRFYDHPCPNRYVHVEVVGDA